MNIVKKLEVTKNTIGDVLRDLKTDRELATHEVARLNTAILSFKKFKRNRKDIINHLIPKLFADATSNGTLVNSEKSANAVNEFLSCIDQHVSEDFENDECMCYTFDTMEPNEKYLGAYIEFNDNGLVAIDGSRDRLDTLTIKGLNVYTLNNLKSELAEYKEGLKAIDERINILRKLKQDFKTFKAYGTVTIEMD